MQLDEKSIRRLLSLSDKQLEDLIRRIGTESGVDLSSFHISSTDAASIRKALSSFTESDLKRANEELNAYKNGKRNGTGRPQKP